MSFMSEWERRQVIFSILLYKPFNFALKKGPQFHLKISLLCFTCKYDFPVLISIYIAVLEATTDMHSSWLECNIDYPQEGYYQITQLIALRVPWVSFLFQCFFLLWSCCLNLYLVARMLDNNIINYLFLFFCYTDLALGTYLFWASY